MRAMDSNLRGFRSESGIRMLNSRSSSPTMSGSAKESKKPESNSDSSASGTDVFFETLLRMATIRSLLSIRSLRAHGEEPVVLGHQLGKEHVAHHAIAGACQVRVVALSEAGLHPLAHGPGAAHASAPVPKRAAGFK